MHKPSVKRGLLAVMIAEHRWGSPIVEENLLSISAIETDDYPTTSDVFDELRIEDYIMSKGKRGIELNNSQFEALTDVLYYECERSRLSMY